MIDEDEGVAVARTTTGTDVLLVEHLSVEERVASGKEARRRLPRAALGDYATISDRSDPIAVLEGQAATRVPELVPIRYGRMMTTPFAFYRGAAAIMASDLAAGPTSGLIAQLCGDAHLSNFGVFASPERTLLFDINDFDETLPGPWEWDLKRLAASFAIAAREHEFTVKQRARIVQGAVGAYREQMSKFATMRELDVWYQKIDAAELDAFMKAHLSSSVRRRSDAALAKARTNDSLRALAKLTSVVDGERRFVSDPPLLVPVEELLAEVDRQELTTRLHQMLRRYRKSLQSDRQHLLEQYRLTQVARKVVGVGSVGTRAWVALLLGRDDGDPLLLQVKEAQPSVLAPYAGRSQYRNQGQRVVAGQHLMQAASDIFLGWDSAEGPDGISRDFYFRQLRDWKASVDPAQMVLEGMLGYARLCGWALARAHARSGDRIAIAAYLGTGSVFEQAMTAFAEAYADQNERDHAALVEAVKTGRVTAELGV
jgi:uncharacterized protein (DUF2252 family)